MAYTSVYDSGDASPVLADVVVAILVAMASFALVIGVGIVLTLIFKNASFLRIGK